MNTEEYIEKLGELLAQNPWQKTWLYDDVMDVPTLEPQLDTLAPLMRFFESTGDRYLILHTKTDRVDALIEAGAPKNTIIAWSLSGPTQSTVLEPRTGTTETRIEAARRCQEAGMTIRYKFKPIIPVKNWREDAEYAIDLALRTTRPEQPQHDGADVDADRRTHAVRATRNAGRGIRRRRGKRPRRRWDHSA